MTNYDLERIAELEEEYDDLLEQLRVKHGDWVDARMRVDRLIEQVRQLGGEPVP